MRYFASCLITLCLANSIEAIEPLPIRDVNLQQLLPETQKRIDQPSSMGLVWAMPEPVFLRLLIEGGTIPPDRIGETRTLLKGKCVVAIVRAHVSRFGSFTFFDESTIIDGTKIAIHKPGSDPILMQRLEDVPPDLTLILNAMKPVMANAMGPLGKNLHFYVLDNTAPDGTQLYNPYKNEKFDVSFAKMGQLPKHRSTHDTICNTLFKPRLCENGKPAHVTWKHDPWTGAKLPE